MGAAANPSFDLQMMSIALRLAKRGLGQTAPNPAVGAVIADEMSGEVIARGWTQPGGRPHAEKEALRRAGARARGQTMYLTLEPCAHTGRLPTCADAMVAAQFRRVVCAIADPNPVISGSGFEQLRAAGVSVDVGLMAEEARWLTLGHILRQTQKRPFVQLKIAVSADGRIAAGEGKPVWVTGSEARAQAHLLRAEADAILVGIKTVFADDPELTCRLPGLMARSPDRVIVDNQLRTPENAKVLARAAEGKGPRVWIGTSVDRAAGDVSALISRGARVLGGLVDRTASGGKARVDLAALLTALADKGVTRVLVEGGPTIADNFLELDLVDEVVVFRGAEPLGGRAGIVAPIARLQDGSQWLRAAQRRLGGDTMTTYRRLARLISGDFA